MLREIEKGLLGLVLALMVASPGAVGAQDRMAVLITNLRPEGGASRKFGETTARELRALFEDMPTHRSVPAKQLEDALDRLDIDADTLTCESIRSLASQVEAPLALCASYEDVPGFIAVTAEVFDVSSGESFKISANNVAKNGGEEDAAEHIFNEFDRYTQQLRSSAICADYIASKVYDQALISCGRSIDINPTAIGPRFNRARALFETEKLPEALEDLKVVLEVNPRHEAALQMAGYISATLGQDADATAYYRRYLETSPEDSGVRMRIAYELAQAGDPKGALELIEEGLAHDSTNVDLWEQLGGFAFSTGVEINDDGRTPTQDPALRPEAADYFRHAIAAYTRVFEAKGAETPAAHLRNIIAAHVSLDEIDEAVAMGERATATHPNEASLWSAYADALQRAGRMDDALAALDRVAAIDPTAVTVGLRRGKWLMETGQVQEGATAFKNLVATDATLADAVGQIVVAHAYANGIQPQRWSVASSVLSSISGISGMSADVMHQINFWNGYALMQMAQAEQSPRNLESARATLPKFQRIRELFSSANVGDYPASVSVNMAELRAAVNQFIEIQERIILRR